MGMTLRIIHVESEFLRVSLTGEFSLDEAKRTFLEILDAVVLHKIEKVLVDGRELVGEPRIIERFYYGEFAAEETWKHILSGVSRVPSFAYILEVPVRDPARFGEIVALNRGMIVKTFDNPEDALRWLGIAPANKPDAGDA